MTIPIFDDALMTDPHGRYAQLRGAGPIHETTTPDGEAVWVITSYAEARAALADPRLSLNKANARTRNSYQSSMPPELDAHLLNMDPPDHTRLRRLVSKAFTPAAWPTFARASKPWPTNSSTRPRQARTST